MVELRQTTGDNRKVGAEAAEVPEQRHNQALVVGVEPEGIVRPSVAVEEDPKPAEISSLDPMLSKTFAYDPD